MNGHINRKSSESLGDRPQEGIFQVSCKGPHHISFEFPLRLGSEIVHVCVSRMKNGIKEKFNQVS